MNIDKKFHSEHYHGNGTEPIDLISDNKLDFCRGSIIKYAYRAGKKEGQEKQDILKIIDYAMLLMEQEGINMTYEDIYELINYRQSKSKRVMCLIASK